MNLSETTPSPELCSFVEKHLSTRGIDTRTLSWHRCPQDGSDRTFYRIFFEQGSLIILVNEHPPANEAGVNENDSFYYLAQHLRSKGIGVPEIYAFEKERGWYILEDLGTVHLQDEVRRIAHHTEQLKELYQRVLEILPLIQVKGAEGFDPTRVHSVPYQRSFARAWESGYFFHSFLRGFLKLDIAHEYLNEEFDDLARHLPSAEGDYFLYRDFQSKNIMLQAQQIRFLDFQGGRRGPLHYDLASLILDPYVELPETLSASLIDYYLTCLGSHLPVNKETFLSVYPFVAIHRAMQILGAFGNLSTVKKRAHFIQYIHAAIKNLQNLCNLAIFAPYKNLKKVVAQL